MENVPKGGDENLDRLEAFGVAVQKMIDEAIAARDSSGIEGRWIEDLRQYYGSEIAQHSYRSMTELAQEGATEARVTGERPTRSRVSVNITRPKTSAAISRISEMMLPTDDKNFAIRPTPNPELSSDLMKGRETVLTVGGHPIMKPDGTEVTAADAAKEAIEEAAERAKRMEREIEDQLVECNYNSEFRKGIWDFCVLGTMILRGPFVKRYVGKRWTKLPDGWTLRIEEKYAPAVTRVSPWNFYPDPAAAGDIERARYVVEVEEFNAKTLRELRGQDGYIASQINECLNEGPRSSRGRRGSVDRIVPGEYVTPDDAVFEVYIVHGEFTKGDLDAAGVEGCECQSEEERQDAVSGCVFICNGRPIKAYLNPLDSGTIPYSVAQYERIDGQMFGVGIPYILRNPAKVVTAGWRMMMDNAALSSGGQIVINRKLIEPADKSWAITGSKLWFAKDGAVDVGHAFKTYQFDTRQSEIQAIIDRALQFAEDESSLPSLLEGNQGRAPDQVGSLTLLHNNANTVLRRVVKTIDDCITDTLISRFYDWNMQYNEDDSIKGDFQIDARGSSALIQRDLQKQMLLQVATYVLHPTLAKFHRNEGYEWLKSVYEMNQIDSKSILVGEDEAAEIIQKMQQPQQQQQDPRLAAAQIRAQLDSAKLQASMQDAERERQADMQKMNIQYQLEVIKYANENKMKLEDVKARMTELLLQQRHEERMQQRELDVKARFGTGI